MDPPLTKRAIENIRENLSRKTPNAAIDKNLMYQAISLQQMKVKVKFSNSSQK